MIQEVRNMPNDNLNIVELKKVRNLSLLMTIIAAIDSFLFYIGFEDAPELYIGAITHVIMLLFVAKIWGCTTYNRTAFYLCIFLNYLLIIPKYSFPNDNPFWDMFGNVMFFIPQYIAFFISKDIKQLTILNINSMMVIGLCLRGELLYNWGLDDLETMGVATFFTFITSVLALFNYVILLVMKYHKLKKYY